MSHARSFKIFAAVGGIAALALVNYLFGLHTGSAVVGYLVGIFFGTWLGMEARR